MEQEPRKVFISHSSRDIDRTMEICDFLEQNDIPCWLSDRDLPVGDEFADTIVEELHKCSCVLLVVSRYSQASKHVAREIAVSEKLGKRLIAVKIEDIEFTGAHEYYLSSSNWATAFNGTAEELKGICLQIGELLKEKDCFTDRVDASDDAHAANQGSPTREITCPICKSTDLLESDAMINMKSIVNGFVSICRFAWKIMLAFTVMCVIIFMLLRVPALREKIADILHYIPIAFYEISNGKIIISFHEGMPEKQFLILAVSGLLLIVKYFFFPVVVLAVLSDTYRAYRYRMLIQKNGYKVQYKCKECRHEFTVAINADEMIMRYKRQTNKFQDVLRAIISCVLLLPCAVILGVVALVLIIVRIRKKLTGNKTKSGDADDSHNVKSDLLTSLYEEQCNICDEVSNCMDSIIMEL